jgi:hypothetical protein
MAEIFRVPLKDWTAHAVPLHEQQTALGALEAGNILFFPQLRYTSEQIGLLRASTLAAKAKNVSFDATTGRLSALTAPAEAVSLLKSAMNRYYMLSRSLVLGLFPRYASGLAVGRTSFRPAEIAGRTTSWRKDDTRLHVDSFPSTPVQGKRILRVFSNVNPDGEPRSWRSGEPFEDVAKKFLPHMPPLVHGVSLLLACLKITKQRRSEYDHYMLKLHDLMKSDLTYQSRISAAAFDFPAGTTWIVYTDQVSHAAMRGSCAFEQTFYIPVECMANPASSPLRVLERLTGRHLVPNETNAL